MRYYKVRNKPKLYIIDNKDVGQVPSDWVDVTDNVRHKKGQKPNIKLAKPKKETKKTNETKKTK